MKYTTFVSQSLQMIRYVILLVILSLLAATAFAQGDGANNVKDSKSYKLPSNIKLYFEDKYQSLDDIISTLQETPNGPLGRLLLSGKLVLKNAPNAEPETTEPLSERARRVARQFIAQEASFLGIENLGEIRERKTFQDDYGNNFTYVLLDRYIDGVPAESGDFRFLVDPAGNIVSAQIELIPSPPELYAAAKKKHLPEKKVMEIVVKDLTDAGENVKALKLNLLRKYAKPKPPYVRYGVTVVLPGVPSKKISFQIDAITGEIITKAVHHKVM
ncbi:hypothetical protein L4X63_07020 [Geomonas sp. Red32]|uniref:hypothetical protein n=1 Tax=Geomonas sp. Red32 TaxID=2912856 RepID=UPI00202CC1A9|nr:hypothetical protein [Geomonas sp. Red32]MCM0081337.1 hypothetical protein [Geomonas sp. Red32]